MLPPLAVNRSTRGSARQGDFDRMPLPVHIRLGRGIVVKELEVVEIVVGGLGQGEVHVLVFVRVALDARVLAAQAKVDRRPFSQLVDGFEETARVELPVPDRWETRSGGRGGTSCGGNPLR